jgi:hypothetical protein
MSQIEKLIHLWDGLVENHRKFSDQVPDERFEWFVADVREAMSKHIATNTCDTSDSSDSSQGDMDDIYNNLNTLTDVDSSLSSMVTPGVGVSCFSSLEISAASALGSLKESVGVGKEFFVRVVEHKDMPVMLKKSPFVMVQDEPEDLEPSFEFKELHFITIEEHGIGLKYVGHKTIKKNTFVLGVKGRWVSEEEAKIIPDDRYVIKDQPHMQFLMDEKFSVDNASLCINQGSTLDSINCGFWFRFHKYSPRTIPPHSLCVDEHKRFYIDLGFEQLREHFPSDIARHQPMVYVYALRNIEPGERLYVDYGEKFWNASQ